MNVLGVYSVLHNLEIRIVHRFIEHPGLYVMVSIFLKDRYGLSKRFCSQVMRVLDLNLTQIVQYDTLTPLSLDNYLKWVMKTSSILYRRW